MVLDKSQGCFYVRSADHEKSRRVEEGTLWWVRESEQEHNAICFMSGRPGWDRLTAAFVRDHNPQTMDAKKEKACGGTETRGFLAAIKWECQFDSRQESSCTTTTIVGAAWFSGSRGIRAFTSARYDRSSTLSRLSLTNIPREFANDVVFLPALEMPLLCIWCGTRLGAWFLRCTTP